LEASTTTLRKTPLHAVHREMGAKMVPFGGWEMPVEYAGLINEHMAVRKAAGLFDVSHMGELEVTGPGGPALPPTGHVQRRVPAGGRPGAVLGVAQRGGRAAG
jgi:aminomethyltransferase